MKLSFVNILKIIRDPSYELTDAERQKLLDGQYTISKIENSYTLVVA